MTDRLVRVGAWPAASVLVVLSTRTLVYALVPRPSVIGNRLEYATGGPRLLVPAALAFGIAAAVSSAVIWVVWIGVAERTKLEPLAAAPARISTRRVAVRAVVLWCASSLLFAGLESYLHWRAGLGWHGLHCLVGPVHRDATPILAALSLIVSALAAAATHLLAWVRRVVRALRTRPGRSRPSLGSTSRASAFWLPRSRCGDTRLGPRAPPVLISALV